ncbi:hypothetical protein GCM10009578_091690 [Streptomyces rhizosphaericus]
MKLFLRGEQVLTGARCRRPVPQAPVQAVGKASGDEGGHQVIVAFGDGVGDGLPGPGICAEGRDCPLEQGAQQSCLTRIPAEPQPPSSRSRGVRGPTDRPDRQPERIVPRSPGVKPGPGNGSSSWCPWKDRMSR